MSEIKRVYTAHTLNRIATSIIGVYIPAYLLTLGFPLSRVILFFVVSHGIGLLFGLFIFVPFVKKWGLLNTFKLYFPLQILYLFMLSTIKLYHIPPEAVALIAGIATFAYWMPMNIFLVRYASHEDMGSSVSNFFALPNLFGVIGPLIGALLIPTIGFWPVFIITIVGLIISFLPLSGVNDKDFIINLNFSRAWQRILRNKTLFLFEFLDNIIEESEWFWSVYVFILIGSLATPGIVGSLESIGGAVFTFFIGKYANKYGRKLIPLAALLLLVVCLLWIITTHTFNAYIVTLVGSFVLNFFLVSYFSTIYRTIKNDNEEEFLILREIPTVMGRMVVFGVLFLTISHLRYFFVLPFFITLFLILLYFLKKKLLVD